MWSRKWVSSVVLLTPILLIAAACADGEVADSWRGVCIDRDQDGYGFQCELGDDCNDLNSQVQVDCGRCDQPNEGCDCSEGSAPIECSGSPELTPTGGLLCREGTRYCRDGAWTACEGIVSYEARPASEVVGIQLALEPADGGLDGGTSSLSCDPCHPDCYRVDPPVSASDAGAGSKIIMKDGGGITLAWSPQEAGTVDARFLDDYDCEPGTIANDLDCNSVPDNLVPAGTPPPFETDHQTIFMELAPGQSAEQNIEINYKLATADVYFYLDMTGSMEEERDNLIESLVEGNYLPDGGVLPDGGTTSCADRDFDGTPDNDLKQEGVTGNIACLIRDARFGAGWFRDVPFSGYGAADYPMFEHRLDVTDDVSAVQTALDGFATRSGQDYVEGSMQGMWAIATGSEVYPGWDRPGIPARTDCPPGTWGYPCFREGAMPIVIHITDQGLHNGPPTTVGGTDYQYAYGTLSGQNRGTPTDAGVYYRPLTTAAETFSDAQEVGTVDNKFITYAGNTEKMRSDLSFTTTGSCPSSQSAWDTASQTAKDAVFKFDVNSYLTGTTPRTIKISALGSRFDSTLQLLSAAPAISSTLSAENNGSFASAYNAGTVSASQRIVVNGDSSGYAGAFAREGLTTGTGCFANATADDVEPASIVKFNLNADSNLRFTSLGTGGVNTTLFSAPTTEPTTISLAGINCGAGTVSNCNDKIGQFNLGDVSGQYVHLTGGNTSLSTINNDYASLFSSCSGAVYDAAGDAVVDFSVSRSTHVLVETSGAGSDMKAGFLHGITLVKRGGTPPADLIKPVSSGNGDQASAATIVHSDIPTNGGWVKYTGDTASDTATYLQSEVGGSTAGICHNGNAGAASSLKDVVFKLDVPSGGGSYEFETIPSTPSSGYQTWLSVHKGAIARATSMAISNASELDTSTGQAVAAQAQGSINNRQIVLTNGQLELRNRSYDVSVTGRSCGSTTGSTSSPTGGRDAVFRFHAAANSTVKVTTTGSTGSLSTTPGFDSYFTVYRGSISNSNRVSSNCRSSPSNPSGNSFTRTFTVEAGYEYLILVKEWQYSTSLDSTSGKFGLVIEDAGFTNNVVGCDAGSYPGNSTFSKLTTTLSAGTHYIIVKGTGTTPNTKYSLNVRKTSAGGTTVVSCVNESSGRAVIDTSLTGGTALAPGDYSVIIKGQTAACNSCSSAREGTYNLTIRDLSVAPKPVACHNTANASNFTVNSLKRLDGSGNLIDYYLVTRGNTGGGAYQLMIEDSSLSAVATASACDNDSGGDTIKNAQITQQLAPGTYYAVLKGRTSSQQGWFQLSIGEDKSSVTSTGNFAPKTWQGTGGVRDALLNGTQGKIRVIAVNAIHSSGQAFTSSTSDYKQTLVMAKETGGLDSSKTKTYEIGTDGSGMGSQVITAVSDLVGVLQMDLTAALDPAPDNPSPGFGFKVEALPNSGNCAGRIDTNADGVVDTHQRCGPGAVPKFKITITNPISNPVPLKNGDPTLGYNMTLKLIGDGRYEVDRIPVYVIPSDVIQTPEIPYYELSGNYEQTVGSTCTGTDRPVWRSLYWNASLPADTSIVWQLCTGDSDSELAACSLRTAGTVTSGAACTQPSACPDGYCASSGVCENVVGPACAAAADCGVGGLCVGGTCRWTQNPIDLMPSLTGGLQGRTKMRVRAVFNASPSRLAAPVLNDWRLDYYCTAGI